MVVIKINYKIKTKYLSSDTIAKILKKMEADGVRWYVSSDRPTESGFFTWTVDLLALIVRDNRLMYMTGCNPTNEAVFDEIDDCEEVSWIEYLGLNGTSDFDEGDFLDLLGVAKA